MYSLETSQVYSNTYLPVYDRASSASPDRSLQEALVFDYISFTGVPPNLREFSKELLRLTHRRVGSQNSILTVDTFASTESDQSIYFYWMEILRKILLWEEGFPMEVDPIRAINNLRKSYELEDTEELRKVLVRHPKLTEFALNAAQLFAETFGQDISLRLEVLSDPDITDEPMLFAWIRTGISVSEALRKINLLEEEWFLDNRHKVGGLFNFNVAW